MKKLKSTIVDGSTMKASKYRPVVKNSDHEVCMYTAITCIEGPVIWVASASVSQQGS